MCLFWEVSSRSSCQEISLLLWRSMFNVVLIRANCCSISSNLVSLRSIYIHVQWSGLQVIRSFRVSDQNSRMNFSSLLCPASVDVIILIRISKLEVSENDVKMPGKQVILCACAGFGTTIFVSNAACHFPDRVRQRSLTLAYNNYFR
jgi:hypothetical protein